MGKDALSIAEGKIVTLHYTLTDDEGEVIDTSAGGEPMAYLHGAQNIVPGLERQLEGKGVGAKLKADVSPAEGYGEREGPGPQPVPRSAFPEDVDIEPGMQFTAEGPDGEMQPVWIAAAEGDTVYVDGEHPLAGVTLHFDIEVIGIRNATEEELAHGHPHGEGGHDHGHHH